MTVRQSIEVSDRQMKACRKPILHWIGHMIIISALRGFPICSWSSQASLTSSLKYHQWMGMNSTSWRIRRLWSLQQLCGQPDLLRDATDRKKLFSPSTGLA
ncbi:unnamed protein product [Cuscuta campestris]|uniref:Uncharacterized protein n=1 Tax=Cuscuta campestris TaxID=132261 RepID=A0A484LL43_9ASTE|nr:unnamed protein product [Cuscuta campestris]